MVAKAVRVTGTWWAPFWLLSVVPTTTRAYALFFDPGVRRLKTRPQKFDIEYKTPGWPFGLDLLRVLSSLKGTTHVQI